MTARSVWTCVWLSTFAVQRLSDLICLEHQLSTIEYKPYRERQKRIVYPPKESNRDRLCGIIDTILAEKPEDYEAFLQKLEQQGYEVKRGKYTAVKGKGQKRFIRFRTLGTGYGEDEIKAVLEGKAKHQPYQKLPPKEQPFQLLVDIQGKMAAGKSVGYKKWAMKFNLKEMSKTLLFFAGAEDQQRRGTTGTCSGGNGTLSCHGRFHQGGRSEVDGDCCPENPHHQLC